MVISFGCKVAGTSKHEKHAIEMDVAVELRTKLEQATIWFLYGTLVPGYTLDIRRN